MISGKDKKIEVNFVSCLFVSFLWELRALRELMISGKEKTKRGRSDVSKVTTVTNDPSRRQLFTTNNNYIAHRNVISNTGSVGALRAPTSSWRPFGPLGFVLRALRALRPCDPCFSVWMAC